MSENIVYLLCIYCDSIVVAFFFSFQLLESGFSGLEVSDCLNADVALWQVHRKSRIVADDTDFKTSYLSNRRFRIGVENPSYKSVEVINVKNFTHPLANRYLH